MFNSLDGAISQCGSNAEYGIARNEQPNAFAQIGNYANAGCPNETAYGNKIALNRKLEKAKEWMKCKK